MYSQIFWWGGNGAVATTGPVLLRRKPRIGQESNSQERKWWTWADSNSRSVLFPECFFLIIPSAATSPKQWKLTPSCRQWAFPQAELTSSVECRREAAAIFSTQVTSETLPLWFVSPARSGRKPRPLHTGGGDPGTGDRAAAPAGNPASPTWCLSVRSGHSITLQNRKKEEIRGDGKGHQHIWEQRRMKHIFLETAASFAIYDQLAEQLERLVADGASIFCVKHLENCSMCIIHNIHICPGK